MVDIYEVLFVLAIIVITIIIEMILAVVPFWMQMVILLGLVVLLKKIFDDIP